MKIKGAKTTKDRDGRTYQKRQSRMNSIVVGHMCQVKVEAIARNEAGKVIARDQIEAAGRPAGVRLLKERTRHYGRRQGSDL